MSATFQGGSHTTGCLLNKGEWEMDSSRVDIQQQLEQPESLYRTQQAEASQSVSSCWGGWGAAQGGGRCDNKTTGRSTTEEWTEEESNSTENYAEVRKGWRTHTLITELNQKKKEEPRPSKDCGIRTQLVLPLWPLAKSREEPCRTVQEEVQFFLGTRKRNKMLKTECRKQ